LKIACKMLELSRNAFYPLIAQVSYLLYFHNFPASDGPQLRGSIVSSQPSETSKRRAETMASSNKKPRTDRDSFTDSQPLVEDSSMTEAPSVTKPYEDGLHWQFLLSQFDVPVVGISQIQESELVDFSDDYRRCGYLVDTSFHYKTAIRTISLLRSVPVWVRWGLRPTPGYHTGFEAWCPSPACDHGIRVGG
jgi:hypothetical protein